MSITVEINGTVANIILSGGIDYSTQEEFKSANKQALAVDNVTEIHVNFAEFHLFGFFGHSSIVDVE